MTRATNQARGAYPNARALRSLLEELFTQSLRQMELLESEDYDTLEDVIESKGALLQMLPPVLDACRKQGWDLEKPSTYPSDPACGQAMREAAEFSVRFQAHEKYVLGEMLARRSRIGERLMGVYGKRNAAAGYRVPLMRGNRIDTAR